MLQYFLYTLSFAHFSLIGHLGGCGIEGLARTDFKGITVSAFRLVTISQLQPRPSLTPPLVYLRIEPYYLTQQSSDMAMFDLILQGRLSLFRLSPSMPCVLPEILLLPASTLQLHPYYSRPFSSS